MSQVISRRKGDGLVIAIDGEVVVELEVVEIRDGQGKVRLNVSGPFAKAVWRREVWEAVKGSGAHECRGHCLEGLPASGEIK